MAQRFRRRRKLIQPGLQLRLSAKFLGLIVLMLGLQYILLESLLHQAANRLPANSGWFADETAYIGIELLGWSALVFLPLTFLVGVIGSFRFAGPLYRFDRFLNAVIAGERPDDIRLRAGDELMDLANLLNEATLPIREGRPIGKEEPGADPESGAQEATQEATRRTAA